MSLGVVVLSRAETPALAAVTSRCLTTLKEAASQLQPDVVVIEQAESVQWPVRTIIRLDAFNFNRFANFGTLMVEGDHLLICNNDLVFRPDSVDRLHDHAERTGRAVVCPVCPLNERQAHLTQPETGVEIGVHFTGWCFLIRRDAWEAIGEFDEDFPFWYADNATVAQLQRAGLTVEVLPSAVVEHQASRTLFTLPRLKRQELTRHQRQRFVAKYGDPA